MHSSSSEFPIVAMPSPPSWVVSRSVLLPDANRSYCKGTRTRRLQGPCKYEPHTPVMLCKAAYVYSINEPSNREGDMNMVKYRVPYSSTCGSRSFDEHSWRSTRCYLKG